MEKISQINIKDKVVDNMKKVRKNSIKGLWGRLEVV